MSDMTLIKKTACLLAAFSMLAAAGCSDKSSGSSSVKEIPAESVSAESTESAESSEASENADSSAEENTDESSSAAESDSQAEEDSATDSYEPGENLANTAALFDGSYTYKAKVTYSDTEGEAELIQVSDGENFYQRNTESGTEGLAADVAYLGTESGCKEIDYNLGVYAECDEMSGLNIFKRIIEEQLEITSTHIPEDTGDYTVEEYTYTGDTYMTVYDLYFDKDGNISSYTVTYTVEGSDDIIQTVEILSVTDEADETLFDEKNLDELKDFDAMTEDERLAFCQGVCSQYSISTDNMYEMDITTDGLKRIDFDSFSSLVYTYAAAE
jgi:hypothetical protein